MDVERIAIDVLVRKQERVTVVVHKDATVDSLQAIVLLQQHLRSRGTIHASHKDFACAASCPVQLAGGVVRSHTVWRLRRVQHLQRAVTRV